VDYK
jgi:hypothetical protein